jgi:hypothetical protein
MIHPQQRGDIGECQQPENEKRTAYLQAAHQRNDQCLWPR